MKGPPIAFPFSVRLIPLSHSLSVVEARILIRSCLNEL